MQTPAFSRYNKKCTGPYVLTLVKWLLTLMEENKIQEDEKIKVFYYVF